MMEEFGNEEYLDEVFEALSSSERRYILGYLEDTEHTTGEKLIHYLEEKLDTDEDLEVILHHIHLPKLKDAGWIDYDDRPQSVDDYDIVFDVEEDDQKDAAVLGYLDQVFGQDDEELDNEFSVLENHINRRTLYWLHEEENKSNLNQIATRLAADRSDKDFIGEEYEPDEDEIRRLKTSMVHVHLPKLEEAGILSYDSSSQKISLTDEYADSDNLLIDFLEHTYEEN